MNDEVWKAALAGLLHDIGKFAQRAQGKTGQSHEEIGSKVLEKADFRAVIPYDWWDDVADAVAYHGGGDTHKRLVRIVRVADWLAAAERLKGGGKRGDPETTPLIPIAGRVELDEDIPEGNWGFPLGALDIRIPAGATRAPLFPQENVVVNNEKYANLWGDFEGRIASLPRPVNSLSRFAGLMSAWRQHTSHIPSATPWEKEEEGRTVPDVSLYDHSKVTAAIASCLCWLLDDVLDELHGLGWGKMMDQNRHHVARLLRGDMSGIQSFIYRITSPERERTHENVAKRLRGRSFYVSLLADVIADWILRQLGLTAANALFIGGGRFDLLVPVDARTEERLRSMESVIQKWLLEHTDGVLGLEMAWESLAPADFKDLKRANRVLDESLAEKKLRKNRSVLSADFFKPQPLQEVCEVCGLTPMALSPEEHTCDLCEVHRAIGAKLPKTDYIARVYSAGSEKVLRDFRAKDKAFAYFGEPIAIGTAFLGREDLQPFLDHAAKTDVETIIYSLNQTNAVTWGEGRPEWPYNLSTAQMYLANAAPVTDGEVWEFDKIAKQSEGAKLLGVLKADVDYLGLLFGRGLEPMTISRVAALSHALDRFFAGYLNTICYTITADWKKQKKEAGEQCPEDLHSLFYVVYAGGDDLLIIGPWDQTVELARRLNEDFHAYTCRNPNITLSAGVVMVKPHFPVQRFVGLADDALKAAKRAGRDRITIFESEPVRWTDKGHQGFDQLLELAHDLREKVEGGDVPSTLLYDIDRLWNKKHKDKNGKVKPMITPDLLYILTRRLPKEVRDELKQPLFEARQWVHIPVSYVSLSLRKE